MLSVVISGLGYNSWKHRMCKFIQTKSPFDRCPNKSVPRNTCFTCWSRQKPKMWQAVMHSLCVNLLQHFTQKQAVWLAQWLSSGLSPLWLRFNLQHSHLRWFVVTSLDKCVFLPVHCPPQLNHKRHCPVANGDIFVFQLETYKQTKTCHKKA